MRLLIILFSTLTLFGCTSQSVQPKDHRKYTIEDFLKTDSHGGGSFSPQEDKILVISNKNGYFQPYIVDIAEGTLERKVEGFSKPLNYAAFFPYDERILFISDDQGNEIYHIYCADLDGSIKKLTQGEKGRYIFGGWNDAKDGFFYFSNERDQTVYDLYEMDIALFEPKLIFQNENRWVISSISPDKNYLALTKLNQIYDKDIYLLHLPSQELTKITPHAGKISFSPLEFEKDSSALYYLSDENSEYSYVKRYNIATQLHETIFVADGDVEDYSISESGKYLIRIIDHGTHSDINIYDRVAQADLKLPTFDQGVIRAAKFSPSEEKICMYVSTSSTPADLFVLDLKSQEVKQLTHSLNPSINRQDLVPGEVITYASFDGLEIPAILYRPQNASKHSKSPAIIHVHGGPSAQTTLGYSGKLQYLINQGYTVLDINYRGSTGYGKTYITLADKKHGDVDLKDCIYGKHYLQSLDWVDRDRIAIMGGSYGGYLVLAALAFEPDSFTCGVDNCGVSNWIRTIKESPPWWSIGLEWLHEKIGDPEKDADYLTKISPLFHADNIKRPLLVIQGANDPRVVKAESDEIVEIVQKNGVPCSYMLFDDEGHGVAKKSNNALVLEEISKFLDAHLKGA